MPSPELVNLPGKPVRPDAMNMHQPRDRYLLFALFAANLVLKLLWTGTNALAHDEPFTVYWALQPWKDFLAMLGTENNPPLYFILMRAWVGVVPLDPEWLRIPSALFSALIVVPLYLLGKRMGGTLAAVAAVLVFSLNNYHYGFAHEVRGYSLFTLLTVTAMWQLVRSVDGRPQGWGWLLVVNILLVYTHFFGWLAVGLQLLLIVVIQEFRPAQGNWWRMAGGLILSYLPYAYIFFSRAEESVVHGTWLSRPHVEEVYNMLWRWSNAPVMAVALLVLVLYTFFQSRSRGTTLSMGAIWTFVPLVGLFLVSYWVPVYLDRYLVFAAPGWALLAGHCLAQLPSVLAPLAALATAVGLALTFSPQARSPHSPEQVVARVEEMRRTDPCAPVLAVPAWYRLTYRFAQAPERFATEAPELIHSNELEPGDPRCRATIVVDASPPDAGSMDLLRHLRSTHTATDSTQASHNVWVKRFMRRP